MRCDMLLILFLALIGTALTAPVPATAVTVVPLVLEQEGDLSGYEPSGDASGYEEVPDTPPLSVENTGTGAAVGSGAVLLGLWLLIVICRGLPGTTGHGSCADDYGCCELDKRLYRYVCRKCHRKSKASVEIFV